MLKQYEKGVNKWVYKTL